MRFECLAACLAMTGCTQVVNIPRPEAPDDARAELVLLGRSDAPSPARAYMLEPRSDTTFEAFDLDETDRIEVYHLRFAPIGYDRLVGEIKIDEGRTPSAVIAAQQFDTRGAREWRDDVQWAKAFRLPEYDPNRCLLDGCFDDRRCVACGEDVLVEAPMPPDPPLVDCGSVLVPDVVDDIPICRPPGPERVPCAPGAVRFLRDEACETFGADCPPDFATNPPADAIFVSRSQPDGGDGSRSAPFNTIDLALAVVSGARRTIAIDRDVYVGAEPLRIADDVTLLGACASETVIARPFVVEGDVTFRDLQLKNLVEIGVGGHAELDGVMLQTGTTSAIRAHGRATLAGTVVRTSSAAVDPAIVVEPSGDVRLEDVVIDGRGQHPSAGIQVAGRLEATELLILDRTGSGVVAHDEADVTIEDGLVQRTDTAIRAETGATVRLRRMVLSTSTIGIGAVGAHIDVDGAWVDSSREADIALDAAATGTIASAVLRANPGAASRVSVDAVGSDLTLRRVQIVGGFRKALGARGGRIELSDVDVIRTRLNDFLVLFEHGASVDLKRFRIIGTSGIWALDVDVAASDLELTLEDELITFNCLFNLPALLVERSKIAANRLLASTQVASALSILFGREGGSSVFRNANLRRRPRGPCSLPVVALWGFDPVTISDFEVVCEATDEEAGGIDTKMPHVDLESGEITGCQVGVRDGAGIEDPHRLLDRVRFRNATNYLGP